MAEYAPRPWRRGIGNDCHMVFDSQGRIVAERCGYDDGHLIAAAPDLMAACKSLLNGIEDSWVATGEGASAVKAAWAALAKAAGQPTPEPAS